MYTTKTIPTEPMAWAVVPTPIGDLGIAATERGVCCVTWDGQPPAEADLSGDPAWVAAAVDALERYLTGDDVLDTVDVDLRLVSGAFHHTVLETLCDVPLGETITYGDLAEAAGNPRAARAVGAAMRANPIPVFVPCHRVLPSSGGLGNYSGAGGPDTKAWLLAHEAASAAARVSVGESSVA